MAETHLIMLIHAAIVVGFILLNQVGSSEIDIKKRQSKKVLVAILLTYFKKRFCFYVSNLKNCGSQRY